MHTCCIKQAQCVWLAANHDCHGIVVKHLTGKKYGTITTKHRMLISIPDTEQVRNIQEGGNEGKQRGLDKLTVGTYSCGNLFVVYEMRRHVLPTAPSPTTTHLMVCISS